MSKAGGVFLKSDLATGTYKPRSPANCLPFNNRIVRGPR
jgi:hypothetical protein